MLLPPPKSLTWLTDWQVHSQVGMWAPWHGQPLALELWSWEPMSKRGTDVTSQSKSRGANRGVWGEDEGLGIVMVQGLFTCYLHESKKLLDFKLFSHAISKLTFCKRILCSCQPVTGSDGWRSFSAFSYPSLFPLLLARRVSTAVITAAHPPIPKYELAFF